MKEKRFFAFSLSALALSMGVALIGPQVGVQVASAAYSDFTKPNIDWSEVEDNTYTRGIKDFEGEDLFSEDFRYSGKSRYESFQTISNEITLENYVDQEPTITIFTHGMGGSSENWLSKNVVNEKFNPAIIAERKQEAAEEGEIYSLIEYNEQSAVEQLRNLYPECDTYIANVVKSDAEGFDFNLVNFCTDKLFAATRRGMKYRTNIAKSGCISDFSKHIVVVYDSFNGNRGVNEEFADFEKIVNSICYDYKKFTGVIPKVNLIGHSRGGLVNVKYASKYPFNVDSIFSMATPYLGTNTGNLVTSLIEYYSKVFSINLDVNALLSGLNNDAYRDIQDVAVQTQIRNEWNRYGYGRNPNIKAHSLMTMTTADFYPELYKRFPKSAIKYEDFSFFIKIACNWLNGLSKGIDDSLRTGLYDLSAVENYLKLNNRFEGSPVSYSEIDNFLNLLESEIMMLATGTKFLFYNKWSIIFNGITTAQYLANKDSHKKERKEIINTIVNFFDNYANQEIVLKNDLFVDLYSGIARDPETLNMFNGFERKYKIYDKKYIDDNPNFCVTAPDFAIAHNIEPFDQDLIKYILNNISVGSLGDDDSVITSSVANINIEDGKSYRIGSSVQTLNITGSASTLNKDVSIIVLPRAGKLTINLNNVNVSNGNENDNAFIRSFGKEQYTVELNYAGTNVIEGKTDISSDLVVKTMIEIDTAKLELYRYDTNSSLTVIGDNGINGTNGADGIDGTNGTDGTNGENGTCGYNGGVALRADQLKISGNNTVYLKGGNGGNGGRGGNGGNGGNGAQVVTRNGNRITTELVDAGNGGNGGHGGNGGSGASGLVINRWLTLTGAGQDLTIEAGTSGNGGRGGNGGNGGDGYSSPVLSTTNGTNGGDGGCVGFGGKAGDYSDPIVSLLYIGNSESDWKFINHGNLVETKHCSANAGLCGALLGNGGNGGNAGRNKTPGLGGQGGTLSFVKLLSTEITQEYIENSPFCDDIYQILNGYGFDENGNKVIPHFYPAGGNNGVDGTSSSLIFR